MIKTVYRIALTNGRFDHARGKRAAIARAAEMVRASLAEVASDPHVFGISIKRVSPSVARSVGLA